LFGRHGRDLEDIDTNLITIFLFLFLFYLERHVVDNINIVLSVVTTSRSSTPASWWHSLELIGLGNLCRDGARVGDREGGGSEDLDLGKRFFLSLLLALRLRITRKSVKVHLTAATRRERLLWLNLLLLLLSLQSLCRLRSSNPRRC
jgi:hypothetical protein